jgi:hypothetical protein
MRRFDRLRSTDWTDDEVAGRAQRAGPIAAGVCAAVGSPVGSASGVGGAIGAGVGAAGALLGYVSVAVSE